MAFNFFKNVDNKSIPISLSIGSITKEIEENDYWLGKQWLLTKETEANEDLIINIWSG